MSVKFHLTLALLSIFNSTSYIIKTQQKLNETKNLSNFISNLILANQSRNSKATANQFEIKYNNTQSVASIFETGFPILDF
jgi:hypothetical protein